MHKIVDLKKLINYFFVNRIIDQFFIKYILT